MANRRVEPEPRTCPVDGTVFLVGGRGNKPRHAIYCSRRCMGFASAGNLPAGRGSHAPRPKKHRDTLHNEAWLRGRYIDELRSSVQIAEELGVSTPSVLWALRKFGIPTRSISDARRGQPNRVDWTSGRREALAAKRRGEANPFHGQVSPHRGDNYHPDARIAAIRAVRARRRGVTGVTYDQMLADQGGACAICRLPEWRLNPRSGVLHTLAVDHDHATGKIRGLLCNRCNIVLGHAKDDIELLRSMIAYLEAHTH